MCESCGKNCKSKGGLTRHENAKHDRFDNGKIKSLVPCEITIQILGNLVTESIEILSENKCYPPVAAKNFMLCFYCN